MKVGTLAALSERELIAKGTGERLSLARSLSDFYEIKSLLVHQETIPPGRRASSAHYHTTKEEIFLVLSGTPSIWLEGETLRLKPGDFVGFGMAEQKAHMLVNDSDEPAVVLTFGTNPPDNEITYVEADV